MGLEMVAVIIVV